MKLKWMWDGIFGNDPEDSWDSGKEGKQGTKTNPKASGERRRQHPAHCTTPWPCLLSGCAQAVPQPQLWKLPLCPCSLSTHSRASCPCFPGCPGIIKSTHPPLNLYHSPFRPKYSTWGTPRLLGACAPCDGGPSLLMPGCWAPSLACL